MKVKKVPSAKEREFSPLQQKSDQEGHKHKDEPKKMLGKEKKSKCK
jgi:hypothetical protein